VNIGPRVMPRLAETGSGVSVEKLGTTLKNGRIGSIMKVEGE
jgi:hypothetical protein